VLYGHVLKNALLPAVTFFGMAIADMIAGSIIIEQVFGIPGLGKTLLTSIGNRDYPVIEAIIVLIAVIVVASNVLVDILYQVLDPRIEID
jgi:ABC-type dipeptide/oligopeptide/nickel transport system permease component